MKKHLSIVGLALSLGACSVSGGPAPQAAGGGKADDPTASAPRAKGRQSASETAAEARNVALLLSQSGMGAIVCRSGGDQPHELRVIGAGSDVDSTGLTMDGDYAYGTNEIQEVFARSSLLINFGEEGNYHLVIPGYAWLLFGYDGSSAATVAVDESATTIGAVFSEQETLDQLSCRVTK